MTDDCKKELAQFRIELGESINRNLPLGEEPLHLPLNTTVENFWSCAGSASFAPVHILSRSLTLPIT